MFAIENLKSQNKKFKYQIRYLFLHVVVLISVCVICNAQVPQTTPTPTPTPSVDTPPVAPKFDLPTMPLPSLDRVGVDTANQLSLSLEEAVEMALKNNNDIAASRKDIRIADFNIRAARGIYDPLLSTEEYYESRTTPTASTIGGAVNGAVTQRQFFGTAGVNGFSPFYGGSYGLNLTASRSDTTNRNSTLNPQYPSSLALTYTQPLFRNFRFDINRRQIEISRKNLSLSESQFRQRATDVIASTEQAYWDLVFALRNLQVQIDAVKQARLQLESNQRLVSKGVLAPIEIVTATAQVTTLEQNVYTAQEAVTRAENLLKTLMLPDRTSAEWSKAFTPTSSVNIETPKIGIDVAVAEALKNRPEITQLQINEDINKIDQRYFKNQTKPQIDLVGSYSPAGLAGTRNPNSAGSANVPANLVGGFFDSFGNLLAQRYPTYRFGVQLSLPLGNRTARANFGRTLVVGEQLQNQLAQQEQIVEAEVRNALQALRSGEARLAAAAATRAAAEQIYESEQRQFRAGTTTFYLVSQRQLELVTARSRELQAQTDLNKAISEFQRAIGNTLSANHIAVTEGGNTQITK